MRTRVKICGITRIEDARQAAQLGADAIGLVFHLPSPRNVTSERAQEIAASLPPFVSRVGLFVDAEPQQIESVLASVSLDLIQFHGNETAEQCRQYGKPYIKAIRMQPGLDLAAAVDAYADASGILLDTYSDSVAGGSGEAFDWSRVPANMAKPLILAGGLDAANVGAAIAETHPYAVDVSSGVEQQKGIKDAAKMAAFINEVNKHS